MRALRPPLRGFCNSLPGAPRVIGTPIQLPYELDLQPTRRPQHDNCQLTNLQLTRLLDIN